MGRKNLKYFLDMYLGLLSKKNKIKVIGDHKVSIFRKHQNMELKEIANIKGIKRVINIGALISESDKEGLLYKDYFHDKEYFCLDAFRTEKDNNQMCCKIEDLEEEFDLVICMSVIEHVEDIFNFCNNLKRIVKENGYLFISVPFFYPIHKDDKSRWSDFWRITNDGVQLLFQPLKKIFIKEMPSVVKIVNDRDMYWSNEELSPTGYTALFKKESCLDVDELDAKIEFKPVLKEGKLIYKSYRDYIAHQAQKLRQNYENIKKSDLDYEEIVFERYKSYINVLHGKNILALGARLGGEVRAFTRLGALAIGVDINPGSNNEYVLRGDFHNLVFSDETFDILFTNAIDHVLKMDDFLKEVKRVLKPHGLFIIELARVSPREGSYEVIDTNDVDSFVKNMKDNGFFVKERNEIINKTEYINWNALLLLFELKK